MSMIIGAAITIGQLLIVAFVIRLFLHSTANGKTVSGSTAYRSFSGSKIDSRTNKVSVAIRREAARLASMRFRHDEIPEPACKYTYVTQDPNFDFNGKFVVDEFAALRRRNEEHERHLLGMRSRI